MSRAFSLKTWKGKVPRKAGVEAQGESVEASFQVGGLSETGALGAHLQKWTYSLQGYRTGKLER
jgi:hypothetical protein